ncbi:MAG TPA: hypothetical protein VMX13_03700 [Sedimentisphaerales bacterium]|nr:hypothetical protein [Sedimentisphaerales bacterium]
MDELRKSMWGAVGLSLALICMLMAFIESTTTVKSEVVRIVQMLGVVFLAAVAISQWVKYLKRYVDYAVEEKLKAHGEKAKG